jgi:hypothetical protein
MKERKADETDKVVKESLEALSDIWKEEKENYFSQKKLWWIWLIQWMD